jgi:hypothetical protein
MRRRSLLIALLLSPLRVRASETLLEPDRFVAEAFGGSAPATQTLWLDDALQARIEPVLGHRYPRARLHYWRSGARVAWVLDEVGKEFPITAGFVVDGDRIDSTRLLIYRESRGDEIRFPAFLKQFQGRRLRANGQLEGRIDGISGATLSVDAMRRMASLALTLSAALAP